MSEPEKLDTRNGLVSYKSTNKKRANIDVLGPYIKRWARKEGGLQTVRLYKRDM